MATATVHRAVAPIERVTLQLSEFEAQVIKKLLMTNVQWLNSGEFGRAADRIHMALGEVGDAPWVADARVPDASRIWRKL